MERRLVRSSKVAGRAQDVLDYLERCGPSTLAAISAGTCLPLHIARYAAVILHNDDKAFVSGFKRMLRHGDRIPRHVAIFSAGQGRNAHLRSTIEEDCALDFLGTVFLQDIYLNWATNRCPVEESDEQL